jgi:hypothetical protein
MRKVVIVGPPPVQVLDVTGPLEVFSSADGYDVTIGSSGPERNSANQLAICSHRRRAHHRDKRSD